MKRLIIYYNFIILSIMTLSGFLQAETVAQLISAVLFFPLAAYFGRLILPSNRTAIPAPLPVIPETAVVKLEPKKTKKMTEEPSTAIVEKTQSAIEGSLFPKSFDIDRRMFLKLIGSAGITMFLFSLFSKKAEGAFFGSVPGPGTLSIKDTSGAKIDPAIKQPTDGYTLAQLDDALTPIYYGYLNKTSAWYIIKEDSSGAYRYAVGSSTFSTNWTNRASLTYDYFDAVF